MAFLVAGLGACGAWWWWRHGATSSGPIVLISIDTLRADHLPLYGYRSVATPAIDALARDGVTFDRAYAHSPQTLPSHASMLSGFGARRHGLRWNSYQPAKGFIHVPTIFSIARATPSAI